MTTTPGAGPTTVTRHSSGAPGRAWHFVEMLVAMFAGMLLLGLARRGLGWTVELTDRPGTWYLLMATDMAIGMAAWMTFRGCRTRHTLEMCAAMYLPLVFVPLVWWDRMASMTFMTLTHVVMVLAMLAVVIWRPDRA